MSEPLSGVLEAAGRVVEAARTHADPICEDAHLSVEGRVAKVAELDAEAKAELARLEQRVIDAATAAKQAGDGAVVEADPAAVAAAAQRLERLRSDGASPDRILARAVAAGDKAMIAALRHEQAYHAVAAKAEDQELIEKMGGAATYLAKLDAAERPFLSDEARAARDQMVEVDRVADGLEAQRRLLDAITSRQVKERPGRDGEMEQHLVANQSLVNQATIAAAYAGVA